MNMLNIGMKFTLEQRLDKALGDLMDGPNGEARYRAMAGIFMLGNCSVSDEDDVTAYTNGIDEVYGRKFFETLSDAQLRYVRVHENKHKMYKHPSLFKWLFDIDASAAGQATDHYINLQINAENSDGFCTMPTDDAGNPVGFADPKYKGKDPVAIFWDIVNEKKASGGSGSNDDDADQQQGSGSQQSDDDNFDDHGHFDDTLSAEQEKQVERAVEDAIRQGLLASEKSGHGDVLGLANLVEPKVDWKVALRDFIQANCKGRRLTTYRRPNRRFMGARIYLPSLYDQRVDDLIIAPDCSGSMLSARQWSTMITELHSAIKMVTPKRVHILYWDSQVRAHETYTDQTADDILKSVRPKGGGGTDPQCIPKYILENKIKGQCAVVLTDGYFFYGQGEWTMPVLWGVIDNKTFQANKGKALHIESSSIR